MEVCRLEDLNEILLVKFRKSAGDMQQYRETCAQVLAMMQLV
jgi:hypothetical protein